MLDKKVAELINNQINKEFYSAYLYLDFANFYNDAGLDGFANYFDVQAQEERDHAMLMRTYLFNNGEKVTLSEIDKPDMECKEIDDARAVCDKPHQQDLQGCQRGRRLSHYAVL